MLIKRFLLLLLLCLVLVAPARAHPGDTDGKGGHYDRSSGEYHYHHGYSAHQHTNGVCPYDFDDRTGWNSGSSSSGGSKDGESASSSSTNTGKKANDTSKSSWVGWLVFGIIFGVPAVLSFFGIAVAMVSSVKEAYQRKKEHIAEREQYLAYAGKTRNEIAVSCGMPEGIAIARDGLPTLIRTPENPDATPWGTKYTFYISKTGNAYHRTARCTKGANIPCHAANLAGRKPCRRCFAEAPDLSWYRKYSSLLFTLERYKIKLAPEKKTVLDSIGVHALQQFEYETEQNTKHEKRDRVDRKLRIFAAAVSFFSFVLGAVVEHFAEPPRALLSLFH